MWAGETKHTEAEKTYCHDNNSANNIYKEQARPKLNSFRLKCTEKFTVNEGHCDEIEKLKNE